MRRYGRRDDIVRRGYAGCDHGAKEEDLIEAGGQEAGGRDIHSFGDEAHR